MKDTKIEIIDDLVFLDDSEALKEELKVFLNTRASHKSKNGKVITKGELEFDINNGLDLEILINESDKYIENYVRKQILRYYKEFIVKISSIEVYRKNRELFINFEYVDIWNNDDSISSSLEV